ncbi:hypothetical protein BDY19DRAFT_1018841 [Irpex rosettiformis]|uniref:Uncharacterized protein n=1 Tax=Irpex rosettiformis TaxID=378272 RepID=A0ACB8TV77_9APHY|nr:hypothetical protein BDY19DRAFT_1018841 [Irpex rosettiformis]
MSVDSRVISAMDNCTQNVSVDKWVQAVCGVDQKHLKSWEMFFKAKDLFNEQDIIKHFNGFCTAWNEEQRYGPFVGIIESTLAFTKSFNGEMEGIAGLPSICDIAFYPYSDNAVVEESDEDDAMPSDYMPDILVSRKGDKRGVESTQRRWKWFDAITCMELKYISPLGPQLKLERMRRNGVVVPTLGDKVPLGATSPLQTDLPNGVAEVSTEEPEISQKPMASSKRSRESCTSSSESSLAFKRAKLHKSKHQSVSSTILYLDDEIKEQIHSYAVEMLILTGGTRMHCVSVSLRDDLVSLWYFDSAGIVRTCSNESGERLSLIDNFERVAAIFVALAYCTPEQFGAFPTHLIQPPADSPFPKSFPLGSLAGCTIDDALFGRRTTVYKGKVGQCPGHGRVVAVKLAQQIPTRKPEVCMITLAQSHGVEHLPEILKWADIRKLSDGIRSKFGVEYDDRILRVIVTPCYVPLCVQLAKDPNSLITMVKQVINCIHDLRYKALILHRDISEGNIMYEKRDGKDWFILNDFDHATSLSKAGWPEEPFVRQHTGTLPFMATDLVRDMVNRDSTTSFNKTPDPIPPHCIKHDFESLFWVSLWCAICFVSPQDKTDPALAKMRRHFLDDWKTGGHLRISDTKFATISSPRRLPSAILSPSFVHLYGWLCAFRDCFAQGWLTRKEWSNEHHSSSIFEQYETDYGEITHNKLLDAFNSYENQTLKPKSKEDAVVLGVATSEDKSEEEDPRARTT